MMNRFCELSLLSLPLLFGACQEQQAPMVNLGVDDSYIIYRMQPLRLHSELTAGSYIWTCTYPDGSQNVGNTRLPVSCNRGRDLWNGHRDF